MSIPGSASPLFFKADAAAADTGYKIDRSLRFDSSSNSTLSRTVSSSGNRRRWTLSWWMKLGALSGNRGLFGMPGTSTSSPQFYTRIGSDHKLYVYEYNTSGTYQFIKKTTAVLRDPSAWYHCVFQFDSLQASESDTLTAEDGFKIYLNGTRITDWDTNNLTNYATGYEGAWSSSVNTGAHRIGRSDAYFDGYMAEIHFVDGQALTASDFGEYDDNNVWQPKQFTGSHNTAGGPDYSSQTITNENSSYTTDKMFDGVFGSSASLDNSVIANETDGTYSVYTFANAISYSSSVRIFADFDTRSTDPDIKANNTSITGFTDNTNTGGANKKWYTVLSGSGTLSTVSLNQHGGYVAAIFAIEVDGTVLVDNVSAGVNGFYLDFSDNSTAAALGNDSSGNDNDFTVNNFSVASGAGNDSLIDTPTNYTPASGNAGGNYAVLNPLDFSSSGSPTIKNGNLDAEAGSGWQTAAATIGNLTSGKWYWEVKLGGGSGHRTGLSSVARSDASSSQLLGTGDICLNSSDGRVYVDGSEVGTGAGNLSGKTVGIALNLDANSVSFYQNNSLVHTVSSLSSTASWTPVHATRYSAVDNLNFGQNSFTYTPPTDHLSICTQNLPDPTISDGSTAMDAVTYTGTGSSQSITTSFSPDLVWIKSRSIATGHSLFDTIRGALERLQSNSTAAEATANGTLTSFDTDGFTLGAGTLTNQSSASQVAWAWDAGTSTVSNTNGSITSSVRANASAGFSIVTYTGNGTAGATVGHGLGAAPSFYVCKFRNTNSTNGPWYVYYKSLGATKTLNLDTTNAASTLSSVWNDTEPSSTVFSLGNAGDTNGSGRNFVAYCFAPVEGYSAFGSYEGNGSASSGPFVFVGFKIRWLMIKNADSTGAWAIYDTARDDVNAAEKRLFPNLDSAESDAGSNALDILSNGFKIRSTGNVFNSSSTTYLYAAFGDPFKTARAR